jgi:hypothetical protein
MTSGLMIAVGTFLIAAVFHPDARRISAQSRERPPAVVA